MTMIDQKLAICESAAMSCWAALDCHHAPDLLSSSKPRIAFYLTLPRGQYQWQRGVFWPSHFSTFQISSAKQPNARIQRRAMTTIDKRSANCEFAAMSC
jgi:hypothetical protein